MVGPIPTKWTGSASNGYWMNYVILTFNLTMTLILDFSRSGIVRVVDMK